MPFIRARLGIRRIGFIRIRAAYGQMEFFLTIIVSRSHTKGPPAPRTAISAKFGLRTRLIRASQAVCVLVSDCIRCWDAATLSFRLDKIVFWVCVCVCVSIGFVQVV